MSSEIATATEAFLIPRLAATNGTASGNNANPDKQSGMSFAILNTGEKIRGPITFPFIQRRKRRFLARESQQASSQTGNGIG